MKKKEWYLAVVVVFIAFSDFCISHRTVRAITDIATGLGSAAFLVWGLLGKPVALTTASEVAERSWWLPTSVRLVTTA
jgi:hypothetical protein